MSVAIARIMESVDAYSGPSMYSHVVRICICWVFVCLCVCVFVVSVGLLGVSEVRRSGLFFWPRC